MPPLIGRAVGSPIVKARKKEPQEIDLSVWQRQLQDIADRVGSSREMVSRVFKQLTAGGYVALRGGRIIVLKNLPARW